MRPDVDPQVSPEVQILRKIDEVAEIFNSYRSVTSSEIREALTELVVLRGDIDASSDDERSIQMKYVVGNSHYTPVRQALELRGVPTSTATRIIHKIGVEVRRKDSEAAAAA